jgi:hypothetical protein
VLYREGILGCQQEFLAYRILYQTVHSKHGEASSLLKTMRNAAKVGAIFDSFVVGGAGVRKGGGVRIFFAMSTHLMVVTFSHAVRL